MQLATAQPEPRERTTGTVDVWFDAVVWCGDRMIGSVVGAVCSCRSPHLHDVVVRDDVRPHGDHPVEPRHLSAFGSRDLATDLTPWAVRRRWIPTRTVFIADASSLWLASGLGGSPTGWPYGEPLPVPVPVPQLRPGDAFVRSRVPVVADGHQIGHLAGLQADIATWALTGVIVDVGHWWHHRHLLLPARHVEDLADGLVWCRGSREDLVRLAPPPPRDVHRELTPVEPRDLGIDDHEPDTAHVEAAHLLADRALRELRGRGFADSEIRHWADAYVDSEGSGDVEGFIDWIDRNEHHTPPADASAYGGTAPMARGRS